VHNFVTRCYSLFSHPFSYSHKAHSAHQPLSPPEQLWARSVAFRVRFTICICRPTRRTVRQLPCSQARKIIPTTSLSIVAARRDISADELEASIPVLGPETSGEDFTIGSTIQSKQTSQYLNIVAASTSYKPLVFEKTGSTTAWGLEGDTIITVTGSSYGRRECAFSSSESRVGMKEMVG
jgi:hypothetical protein